jgi:hypothetical protein
MPRPAQTAAPEAGQKHGAARAGVVPGGTAPGRHLLMGGPPESPPWPLGRRAQAPAQGAPRVQGPEHVRLDGRDGRVRARLARRQAQVAALVPRYPTATRAA